MYCGNLTLNRVRRTQKGNDSPFIRFDTYCISFVFLENGLESAVDATGVGRTDEKHCVYVYIKPPKMVKQPIFTMY
jgi:hypothetical protein